MDMNPLGVIDPSLKEMVPELTTSMQPGDLPSKGEASNVALMSNIFNRLKGFKGRTGSSPDLVKLLGEKALGLFT